MKRNIWSIGVAAMLVCVLLVTGGCSAATGAGGEDNTIQATGRAGIEVSPDLAKISIGVVSVGATSEEAREQNAEAINATIEAVKALGVAEEDIETSNLSLWPRYSGEYGDVISGYQMSMTLTITARDVNRASEIMDAAIASGSNTLENVSFEVSNEEELYIQALGKAIEVARQKADQMAATANKTVQGVKSVTEESRGVVFTSDMNADTGAKADPMTGGGAAATNLMIGTTTITAQVSVTFTIE